MKFKFDKNLDYQLDAINSIVEIFDTGKNIIGVDKGFKLHSQSPVVANELEVDEKRIFENVKAIQEGNKIKIDEENENSDNNGLDFSVEMETGTGKTYVYLRTIFELNQKYGLKKFITLVPSVAIREGVLKTLEQTKDHFRGLYNTGYSYFAYDSSKLSKVREFAQSIDVQIMIMTIQSFNKDANIMRQTPDRFNGESPLNLVAGTNPVVIMDEPQNMESELSKSAIADLKALFKLRYSATHKNKHNLMYVLDPTDAYKQGLVKKIEVFGVEEDDPGAFIFKIKEIRTKKNQNPTAIVNLEVKNADGSFSPKDMVLKHEDELIDKTSNEKYGDLIINEIDARYKNIELSNGKIYKLEEEVKENKEEIFRMQIRETIKAHFNKQGELGNKIKVLSLFFIDKVDNYIKEDSLIRGIFEDEFEKLKSGYSFLNGVDVEDVHNGYFSKKRERGVDIYKDTTGKTKADKEVYDLIMKDKERLLSFEEPTSFIFSHSALKEGWDNPNIFQICTLNETRSTMKKRQEIGRGLRLAVDIEGNRIFDDNINILTVVPNESYRDFVGSLQTEYDEAGYRNAPSASNARRRVNVKFNKRKYEDNEDFKKLWNQIKKKTKFNIELDKKKLVKASIEEINKLCVGNLVIRVNKVLVDFEKDGKLKTIYKQSSVGEKLKTKIRVGNILDRIVREVGITKMTAFDILSGVKNLKLIFKNPEEYIRSVSVAIRGSLSDLLINDGLKYSPVKDVWEVEKIFEDFKSYQSKTIEAKKSVYNRIVFDSVGEREFAESLEKHPDVKLFVKLPSRFVVDTPLGTYNPDWAIVMKTESGDKLYLVRETKFVTDLGDLRADEKRKIVCGRKHFGVLGVDFEVAQKADLSDLSKRK